MNKLQSTFVVFVTFSLVFTGYTQFAKAQSDTDEHISYGSGTTVYSPLNTTYTTDTILLNITFNLGLGVQCSLNYSLDGQQQCPIPLVQQDTQIHISNRHKGIVELPELSDGSHCLTVHVFAAINDFHGATPPSAPFEPAYPGSFDYIAKWDHTIWFTVDATQQKEMPEFPLWMTLLVAAILAVLVWVIYKNYRRKHSPKGD